MMLVKLFEMSTMLCLCYSVPGVSSLRWLVISLERFYQWLEKHSPKHTYHLNKCRDLLSLNLEVYKVYSMLCLRASTVCVCGGGVF